METRISAFPQSADCIREGIRMKKNATVNIKTKVHFVIIWSQKLLLPRRDFIAYAIVIHTQENFDCEL